MTLRVADWVIPLFFLTALVLLLRYRRQLQAEDKESYRYIGVGLVLLALVSLSRLYFVEGYFVTVPFLSDVLFYRITSWIVIVTGATLVVSGISSWLPIARRLRGDNDQRMKRLEVLKHLEQMISLDYRPEVFLQNALAHVVDQIGLARGAVYRYSETQGRAFLTGIWPRTSENQHDTSALAMSVAQARKLADGPTPEVHRLIRQNLGIGEAPHLVLPIVVDTRIAGFFVFWQAQGTALSADQSSTLKMAVEICARRIAAERFRAEAHHYRRASQLHFELDRIQTSGLSNAETMAAVLRRIRAGLDADVVALWLINKAEEFFTRYTIGEAGSLLLEKGLPVPEEYSELTNGPSARASKLLCADHATRNIHKAMLESDFKSGIAAPILDTDRMSATLLVGSRELHGLTQSDVRILDTQLETIRRMVGAVVGGSARIKVDRSLLGLNRLWSKFHTTGDLQSLFEETCRQLAKVLPVDVVRISTTDLAGQFLTSQALHHDDNLEAMTPPRGRMIRSLMPCHEQAIRTGKICHATTSDPASFLKQGEATQLLSDDLRFITAVPIKAEQRVAGVICLGQTEGRAFFGLGRQDLLLARTAAQGIGFGLAMAQRSGLFQESSLAEPETVSLRSDFAFRSRVKSSLSGIFGSVELLKAQQESPDPQINRYLTIIDRSARRISEYLDPQEITSTFK